MTAAPLILGSSSRYRAELLARLHLPFTCVAPEVDENPRPGESPQALAERLARSKALEVARRHPDAWVIGADQVADLAGEALGKPGDAAGARAQLQRLSGRSVVFHSALALAGPGGLQGEHCIPVRVRFRRLDEAAIARYIALEPAFDCAGSAKCEGLGIALLEAIESEDPTALIGLPLIATAALLRGVGLDPLGAAA